MGSLYRKDVIDIALEQDGYQGNGKYCKYSKDLDAVNYFNMEKKNGEADWCSIFVNWCVYMSTRNLSGKIEPDKWDAHYFTFEPDSGENLAAGCGYAADYYMSHDAWSDDCQGACRGDQVFFRKFAHTGLVTGYDDEGIYTIEGNIDGGKVGRRYYKFDDPSIDGFGHIRYDGDEYPAEESEPDITEPEPEPTPDPEPEPVQPPVSSNQGTVYTVRVGSWLNIREEPNSESRKLGELYDGAKVLVFEIDDGWARIGDNMWVFADFLD